MRRIFNTPGFIIIILLFVSSALSGRYASPIDWIMSMVMILPGIIIGLSFHEFAHAYAAVRLGDNTPRFQGRVTINPKAHIDPIGFACLLLVGFGWGVPVQIDPGNFKNRRRDELIVSVAGVAMNFVIAIVFAGIWRLLYLVAPQMMIMGTMGEILSEIIAGVISINLVLLVFNLIPIPPLDGFGIITEIFNLRNTNFYWTLYKNGFFILLIMILFGVTDKILGPLHAMLFRFVTGIFF